MLRKYLNNKGFVLLYVLEIILLLTVISTAVLVIAYSGTRQSIHVENHEQTYYEAEAVLNVTEALFSVGIVVLPSATGSDEYTAKANLLNSLESSLESSKSMAMDEIDHLYSSSMVTVDINYEINENTIMAEISDYDEQNWISFFGGGNGGGGDTYSVLDTIPLKYTISATVDNRKVELVRQYTISGATFTKAKEGVPGNQGFKVGGGNLINGIASWLKYTRISIPQGLYVEGLRDSDGNDKSDNNPTTMAYPGMDLGTTLSTISSNEFTSGTGDATTSILSNINRIIDEEGTDKVYRITGSSVDYRVNGSKVVQITPEYIKSNGYTVIHASSVGVELRGDFTDTGLRAVYTSTSSPIVLGNSYQAFSCDRRGSDPLYMFSEGKLIVYYYGPSRVSNALIGAKTTINIEGDSGDEYIYCDAQFYGGNSIYLGVKSPKDDLNVNNWDPTGVPSFIACGGSGNIYCNVEAANGFSGIFYTQSSPTINVNAPSINGAFLLGGVSGGSNDGSTEAKAANSGMTLSNDHTNTKVEMKCEINSTAYDNLHNNLKEYFQIINDSLDYDPNSDPSLSSDGSYNTADEEGNIIYNKESPAIVREVNVH